MLPIALRGVLRQVGHHARRVLLDAGARALVAVLDDARHGARAHEIGEALAMSAAVCAWRLQRDPRDTAAEARLVAVDALTALVDGARASVMAHSPACECVEPDASGAAPWWCVACARTLPAHFDHHAVATLADLAAGLARASEGE